MATPANTPFAFWKGRLEPRRRKYYKPPKEIREMLLKMSPSTIDNLLRSHLAPLIKGLTSTRPSAWVTAKTPIKLLDGEVRIPGYIEADTVSHCGNSIAGEYANSLTVTDLFSAWTEIRGMWTKTAVARQLINEIDVAGAVMDLRCHALSN